MASGPVSSSAGSAPAHSAAYRTRRFLNWFPLGLAYAFLYMGRYNLNVAKHALGALMTNEDFGWIFGLGTVVYGFAFVVNGPLAEKIGGRRTMLISLLGATLTNLSIGLYIQAVVGSGSANNADMRVWLSVLYALNMYFQSFGAVAIVSVNSSWFHVRERGGFSGIFGTMISSGIFLAYSVNGRILELANPPNITSTLSARWVFFVPSALLALIFAVEFFLLKDRPSQAGFEDFDTGSAKHADDNEAVSVWAIFARLLKNPIILTMMGIEFCTGVIRQAVMQYYPFFRDGVLALPSKHPLNNGDWGWASMLPYFAVAAVFFVLGSRIKSRRGLLVASGALIALVPFVWAGWGGLLFVAGVIGGNVAGYVSDLFFGSRRAPAAGGLYVVLIVGSIAMAFTMGKTEPVIQSTNAKGLEVGDRILEVAGQGELKDWPSVARAIAAIPAPCTAGSRWDSLNKMCSSEPAQTDPNAKVSTGKIPLLVERGGQKLGIEIDDPGMKMRAGDQRTLKGTTPVSSPSPYVLGAVIFIMSLAVIGTHGLLSGTATMDFGGKKGTAITVGMIDGAVYLGTAVQSVSLGYITSRNWAWWPWFMLPFAILGFVLCRRIWDATPARKKADNTVPLPANADAGQAGNKATGT
ncbi:MAG: MFS transporter [Myxococcaceae bacterium]